MMDEKSAPAGHPQQSGPVLSTSAMTQSKPAPATEISENTYQHKPSAAPKPIQHRHGTASTPPSRLPRASPASLKQRSRSARTVQGIRSNTRLAASQTPARQHKGPAGSSSSRMAWAQPYHAGQGHRRPQREGDLFKHVEAARRAASAAPRRRAQAGGVPVLRGSPWQAPRRAVLCLEAEQTTSSRTTTEPQPQKRKAPTQPDPGTPTSTASSRCES
jgi:hypothetical protein